MPDRSRFIITLFVLAVILTLAAGFWIYHCDNDGMSPDFCAKMLAPLPYIALGAPLVIGWIALEMTPVLAPAPLARFYRPPRPARS